MNHENFCGLQIRAQPIVRSWDVALVVVLIGRGEWQPEGPRGEDQFQRIGTGSRGNDGFRCSGRSEEMFDRDDRVGGDG